MTQNSTTPAAVAEPITGRRKSMIAVRALLNRLRFIAVLVAIGAFIAYWDSVKLHWDRWMHPRSAAVLELPLGQEFFCPMDPQVHSSSYEPNGDVPNCPICGMPLVLHAKGQTEELPPGVTGRVALSPNEVAVAGIKTATIGYRPMVKHIKTVGFITFDESGLSRIVSRVGGYVEKLYVDKSYTMVHKGEPLAAIYSPEVYSAAREMVLSLKGQGAGDIAASAREKLILLGVAAEDVDRMIASGQSPKDVIIRSPVTGHVIDKKIEVGASVEAKMTLFEVADLSTVWLEADVYESDAPFLRAGDEINAKVEAYPNRAFKGKIALVHPHLEIQTRTNRIRVRLDNPNHELRPGMYAEVTIEAPMESVEPYKTLAHFSPRPPGEGQGVRAEFIAVPESAVIDTGEKKIVYVQRGEGQFEGREVELGPRQGDFYPVLKGLVAGDRVAAAGSFLVDAETRLNPAAASTYFGASGGGPVGGAQLIQTPVKSNVGESQSKTAPALSADDLKNIDKLPSEEDQRRAKAQASCPVTDNPLGLMGVPVKITLRGKTVFLCCKACVGKAKAEPEGTLKKLESKSPSP